MWIKNNHVLTIYGQLCEILELPKFPYLQYYVRKPYIRITSSPRSNGSQECVTLILTSINLLLK